MIERGGELDQLVGGERGLDHRKQHAVLVPHMRMQALAKLAQVVEGGCRAGAEVAGPAAEVDVIGGATESA